MTRIRISAIAQLQKSPITASSENVPDSQSSAYRRKYYNSSFQTKSFMCLYLKKYILLNLIFGKYLELRKELTRFGWSKPLQKCWTGVTFGNLS